MFAFPSGQWRKIERMFFPNTTEPHGSKPHGSEPHSSKPQYRLAKLADAAVEFATLGEYRIVVREEPVAAAPDCLWVGGIEWVSTPRRRETTCRLPRAHDRGARLAIGS